MGHLNSYELNLKKLYIIVKSFFEPIGKKVWGAGEEIFAYWLVIINGSAPGFMNLFSQEKTHKFFFLHEWIVLGNIMEIV